MERALEKARPGSSRYVALEREHSVLEFIEVELARVEERLAARGEALSPELVRELATQLKRAGARSWARCRSSSETK